MALNIRFTADPKKTLTYKIEQLTTGLFYDFSTGTFEATPKQLTAPLPESSDLGGYDLTLKSTPANVFTDGHYSIRVMNGNTSEANLAARMINGDDAPPKTVGAMLTQLYNSLKGTIIVQ